MRIERLGDGEPELAVVAAVHGDEPCGVRAIERLLDEDPTVEKPVKLVIVNERALDREVRFTEEDLNRAFPGDPDADTYERRLAYELRRELRDCLTFSMHSTQSYREAFAIVDAVTEQSRAICSRLPIDAVVETGPFTNGRLISVPGVVEAECGRQGTEEAAANAYALTRAFLAATGAIELDPATPRAAVPVYRLERAIPKTPADSYEVFVANFERVAVGTAFAAADGDQLVAEEPFYPVLMSTYGYQDVFGYAASKVGTLDPTTNTAASAPKSADSHQHSD
jgi:succinylglutamate desuccinylase